MRLWTTLCSILCLLAMLPAGSFAQDLYVRGNIYVASDELGSPGAWGYDSGNLLVDDGTGGDLAAGDGIFSRLIPGTVLAGDYEAKFGSADWSEGYPNGNIPLTLVEDNQDVLFTLDTNFYDDGFLPESNIVWCDAYWQATTGWYVVGSAPEIGAWDPTQSVPGTEMEGGLIRAELSFGTGDLYQYKWIADQQWGPEAAGFGFSMSTMANLNFETLGGGYVFVLNPVNGRVKSGPLGSVATPDASWGRVKSLYVD